MQRFASLSPGVRLHAGDAALDLLPREADRLHARRAFIVSGHSVATRTPLVDRLRTLLADRYAGAYTALGKDAPLGDVRAAAAQASACGADLLIAVGAGSVLKATRVIAIALGEDADLAGLATRYPADGPPVSPRLHGPRLPIFNVLTAPTSAQHRAGAALRRDDGGPRLEFFDPRTRPAALFWDRDALLTAPPGLALSTGLGVFWRALMNAGALREANPLVQASRRHAWTLSERALPRMRMADAAARIDMCAAALLQNRDEDDGGRPFDAHWIARAVYALGAALFNLVPHLDQGTTHALLTSPAIRHFAELCPQAVAQMADALALPSSDAPDVAARVADHLDDRFRALGLPRRLATLPGAQRQRAVDAALFNFNADRERELARQADRLHAMLMETT